MDILLIQKKKATKEGKFMSSESDTLQTIHKRRHGTLSRETELIKFV